MGSSAAAEPLRMASGKTQGWHGTGVQREAQAQNTAQPSAEAGVVPGSGDSSTRIRGGAGNAAAHMGREEEKRAKSSMHLCQKQDGEFLLTFRLLLML